MPIFKELMIELEHFETDPWSVEAILDCEIMTSIVVDPCTGTGILAKASTLRGYDVVSIDIYDYGYKDTFVQDFLTFDEMPFEEFSVIMNPPYSKAENFVDKAFELGARKIICFQRFSWWEGSFDKGKKRGQWWGSNPPNRIYICGDRAHCWRHDLPSDEKGNRYDPKTGRKLGGTPTAHAWFVWEKGNPKGTLLGHIYKQNKGPKQGLTA